MRVSNSNLGGEPSGHIIRPKISKTGDGILSALKVIEAMKYFDKPLSKLKDEIQLYPQEIINVKVKSKTDFNKFPDIVDEVKKQELKLNGKGRVLLRYSGTESLARVMVEGESATLIAEASESIAEVVEKCLG